MSGLFFFFGVAVVSHAGENNLSLMQLSLPSILLILTVQSKVVKYWNDKTQGQYNQVQNSQNSSTLSISCRRLQETSRVMDKTSHAFMQLVLERYVASCSRSQRTKNSNKLEVLSVNKE